MAPDSPHPLAPSGLWVQGWLSSSSDKKSGKSRGAGDGVVHERRGQELPLVVDRALRERLADPLRQAAVELALDDHRIDHRADIVHRVVRDQLRGAGLRIDFHLADMRAIGEGEVRRVVERVLVQAGFE